MDYDTLYSVTLTGEQWYAIVHYLLPIKNQHDHDGELIRSALHEIGMESGKAKSKSN